MIHNLVVLDLEKAKDAQAKEIAALKKRIQKLERKKMSTPIGLKRLKKVGESIADIDADVEVTLVDETQERQDDELMFDTGVLDTDEMHVEAKVIEKDEQSTKLDDSTAGKAVTTASVEDSAAPTTIKEISQEQKLARKQEEEANIALIESWENTQAMMEADRLLAKRLQSKEREEMLQDIDREDLETLWKLVKTKHGDKRPEDEHERVLWGDFKVMFEPDIRSLEMRTSSYVLSTAQAYGKAAKSVAGEKVYAAGLQLLEDFLLSRG
ncbi:hypothetical protein Tco_0856972 [Tanacetum coccineum]|uniref:Uncharacterized protein n=1 Tax=Tanacetum coccineum TaxID=301880 RepID=A0ABQ5B4V9_9ASTR